VHHGTGAVQKSNGTFPHSTAMVFDTECMLTDPVSMLDRCERQKQEALQERHQHVDRCLRARGLGAQRLASSAAR